MAEAFMGKCGIYCGDCKFRQKTNCPGCGKTAPNMFWGECRLARCCIEKGYDHCGLCPDVPCAMLKEFSFDATHGDNGVRIERCMAWAKEGFAVWVAGRGKQ